MKVSEILEGEVIPFPIQKQDSKYNITFDDLYRNFIHLWNTGDEWGDVMSALFAVAIEIDRRGEGPPDDWDFNPGAGIKSYEDETDQDKYDQAVRQQQGTDEDSQYEELKHADTPSLEKFGEMLIRLRDKLDAKGKSY